MNQKLSPIIWALAPLLLLGPTLTCMVPRIMAPLFDVTVLAAILIDVYQRRAKPLFDKQLAAVFGALLLWGTISQIWTINPDQTPIKVLQLALPFGLSVLLIPILKKLNKTDIERLGTLLIAGLGLGIIAYFVEMTFGYPLYDLVRGGYSDDIADVRQNKPAVLLALWAYMVFPFLIPYQTRILRVMAVLLGVFLFEATFSSKSASAQMILAAVPVFAAVLWLLPARLSLGLTLIFATILTMGMPFIAVGVDRHTDWRNSTVINDSLKSRIEIWDQAARRTFERPVLGWGLDASPKMPNRDDISYMTPTKHLHISHLHPHNGPLQIWFELGLIGIACVVALYALFYRRIKALPDVMAQKYAIFMWATTFFYTLSIWGIWQSWFVATLCFVGLMTYVGLRHLEDQASR